MFAAVLTVEGEVFTWGSSMQFGQLGFKDTSIIAATRPNRVHFKTQQERIIDIAAGFNHCIALTDNKQVYVWGRKMGIFPSIEINYHSLEATK
jgi:alpha-tubulin suppressor-like RCC1 family protein